MFSSWLKLCYLSASAVWNIFGPWSHLYWRDKGIQSVGMFYCLRVEVCFPDVVVDSEGWEGGLGCVFFIKRNWPGNSQFCVIQGETSGSGATSCRRSWVREGETFHLPAACGLMIIGEWVVILTQTVAQVATFPDISRLACILVIVEPVTLGNLRTPKNVLNLFSDV